VKLRLLMPVVIGGHPGLKKGDVFEHTKHPQYLIGMGFCEEVKEEALKYVEEIATREPEIENRDPQPKRSQRKLA
jgi:hypothetical protein